MNIIAPAQWNDNLFDRIGKDWMLITAESEGNVNTMTASYGGFGILFSKPLIRSASIFICFFPALDIL